MNAPIITLTREELYKDMWESPAARLCRKYGISNVALAKICTKHNIPRPGRGYWQRLRRGIKKAIPGLPPSSKPETSIAIRPQHPCPLVEAPPSVIAAREFFAKSDQPIKLSGDLRNAHPLVRLTNAVFEEERNKTNVWSYSRDRKSRIDVSVERHNERRALLFADTLFKTLEQLGHHIEIDERHGRRTAVKVDDDKVFFTIKDIQDIESDNHGGSHRRASGTTPGATVNRGKNRLRLEIDERYVGRGFRQVWTDGKLKTLGEQIPSIVEGMLFYAVALRTRRLESEAYQKRYEEESRKRAELERLQQEELKARSELERQAGLWEQCRNLRAFIDAIEDSLTQTATVNPGSPQAIWLNWARQHAERMDPMTSGYLKIAVMKEDPQANEPEIAKNPTESFISSLRVNC